MKKFLLAVAILLGTTLAAAAQEERCSPWLWCQLLGNAIDPGCWCYWGDEWYGSGEPPIWWREHHHDWHTHWHPGGRGAHDHFTPVPRHEPDHRPGGGDHRPGGGDHRSGGGDHRSGGGGGRHHR